MTIYDFSNKISNGGMDELFLQMYRQTDMEKLRQRARYLNAAENFSKLYPQREEIHVFSVPANTEICGNHMNYQCGCVFTAAVTLDILAIVAYHDESVIRISCEGVKAIEIDISDLSDIAKSDSKISAVICGIVSDFIEKGMEICGFDAYITSDITAESGLSTSAALEILICNIINNMCESKLSVTEVAKIGWQDKENSSENSCDFIKRLTCASCGILSFDMNNSAEPKIHKFDFDFSKSGYSLCVVNVKENCSDYRNECNEIIEDMKSAAKIMGVDHISDADEEKFYDNLPEIREKCNDRVILSAAHFFDEKQRTVMIQEALEYGRLTEFFSLVNQSAESWAMLANNINSLGNPVKQALMVALTVSKRYLRGAGAVRVCSGSFTGAIQAFVPNYMVNGYIRELDRIFGSGSTQVMGIRNENMIELFN